MALLIPTLGGNKKRKDDLLGSLSNLDVRTNNAVTNQNNGGGLVNTVINKVNNQVESARSRGLIPSPTKPITTTSTPSLVSEPTENQNRNVLNSLNNLEIKPTTLSPLDKLNKANGGEQDRNGKMSFDEFKATMTAKNVINQGGTGAPIKASAIKNAQGLNAANSMYDEAHKNEQSTFKSPVRGLKQYTADDSKNYYKDDSLKLNRSLVSNLRNLDDDGSNYDDEHWAHQKMVGQIFKPALNGKENDENYLKGTSYRSLLDSYNNANGDQQADIKKDLSNYIIDLREEAKKSDPEVAAAKLKSISYLSDLNRLLDQYGHDKGKSFGRQAWDWLSTGGFLGDIGGNALEQGLGNITGLGEKTKANIEKTENKRDDLGLVGGVGGTLGAIGNFGLNIATGGAAGAATAGIGGLNTMADANNKVLDFDKSGNAIIRKKDIKENLGEFGKSLLDLGFAGAGVKGIGPSLKPSGVTADGLSKLTAKDLAKYALQEAPWAAGTTYGQEALNNLAQNKEDWYNVDAGQFAKDLALNLGQDIGMDTANYRAGKVSDSQAPDANFTQRVKGSSDIEGQAGKVKPEITKPTDELSSVKYTQDGQAVKVNQDGTASRLSNEELARKAAEAATRPLNSEQTAIRTTGSQNEVVNDRISTDLDQDVIRQQNTINPIRDNGITRTQVTRSELESLLTRANSGDMEAMRILEEYGYKPENTEQQTGWRPKTVDEVIKPEEAIKQAEETGIKQDENTNIKAQNEEPQRLINGKNADELGASMNKLIDKLVDNTTRYVDGDKTITDIRQNLEHGIYTKTIDEAERTGLFEAREKGKISDEEYYRAIQDIMERNARASLNETELARLMQETGKDSENNTEQIQRNELADAGEMVAPKESIQDATIDTRAGDSLETDGSTTEKNFTVTNGVRTVDTINGQIKTYTGGGEWNGSKVYLQDGEGVPVGYKIMADENAAPSDKYVAIVNNKGEKALIELPHASEYDYERIGLATGRTREGLEVSGLVEKNDEVTTRTPEQQRLDMQMPKNEVSSIDQLVKGADTSTGNRFTTVLRGVNNRLRSLVKNAIGVDINGYNHVVTESSINHTLNRHGNKGELSVTMDDIKKIPDIIKNADSIEYVGKNKHGLDVIRYAKAYDNRVIYMEEIRNGRHQLAMDTMYKQDIPAQQKSRLSSESSAINATDSLRALSRSGEIGNSSIPQDNENVNAKSSFAQNTAQNRNFSSETKQALKNDPLSYKPTTNEERLARANEILSNKSADEIDNYLRENFFNVKDSERNSGDMVLAGEFAKYLDAKGQFDRSTEIINKMSDIGTKQGQNIQALSLMMNRSPEGIANMAQTAIKKGGGEMTPELRKQIVEKTQEIGRNRGARAELANENATISEQIMNGKGDLNALRKRQTEIAQAYRRLLDSEGRQFSELSDTVAKNSPDKNSVFGTIWRGMMLSGPRTHTGNAVSNTFQNILNAGADRFAAGLDWARAKVTNTEREVVGSNGGRMKGLKRGLGAAGEALKTGNNLWESADTLLGKTDAWGQGGELEFKNKVANAMVAKPTNFVFRAMSAGDLPFRYAAFENAVRTEAKRQGINKGYRGQALEDYVNSRVATPDPELQEFGIRKGNEAVYDADTILSKAMGAVDKLIEGQDNKIVKTGLRTAKTILAPFVKVPSKVLSTAIDYSPLGAVKSIVKKAGSKNYTTAQFETDLARSGLGTGGLVGLGYALSAAGLLTGSYPSDPDERNRWKAEGIQPNSIKIGDTYLSLNYLGPASMLMSMGSGVQQRQAKGEDPLTISTGTIMDTLNTFLDQSYVQGMNSALQAVTDSSRYGESYVNSLARGLVPNLLRQTANATDPMQRQTNNAGEAILSGIPGLSQTLDAKVDAYGREIENKQAMPLGQMWDAFKLTNSRETNQVIDEVKRLHEVDPENKDLQVTPGMEDNTLSVKGKNVRITDEQKTQLQKDVGTAATKAMQSVINSSEYAALSDTEKAKALDKARSDAAKQAREQFIKANNITADNNPNTKNTGGDVADDFADDALNSATSGSNGKKSSIKINDSLASEHKDILKKYNSMSKEKWDEYINGESAESAAAEYKLAKAKYENDVASGKLTDAQKIKRQKELEKMAVSKDWSKSVRDAYSLAGTKADIQKLLSGIEDEGQRAEMVGRLNGLNEAMYNAGLINKSTYNSRGRNINNLAAKKGGSGGKKGRKSSGRKGRSGSGSGSNGITAAEASAMTSAIKALSEGANFGYDVEAPKAPNTGRKMQKTRSSKNNYNQKTYAPKKANITVQKGQQKGVKKK